MRNLTEEQRYKVTRMEQADTHSMLCLYHEILHSLHVVPSSSRPVGLLSPAGLRRLQVVPHQGQHRTDESAAGGRGSFQGTSQAHDGLFKHFTQHL